MSAAVKDAVLTAERGNIMKKTVLALLLLCAMLCMVLGASAEGEDALAKLMNKGEIVIACEGTYSPWNYIDENTDELMGYDVEVGAAIAEKLGLKPVFKTNLWDNLFMDLDNGANDLVIASVEPTEDRAEKYDFSTPYAYTRTVLVVREDNDKIKSFADLAGMTTCNTITSVYAMIAEANGATVLAVDDLGQTMEHVIQGRCDGTLNADTAFYDFLRAVPDAPLKIVDATDDPVTIVVPIPKGEEYASLLAAVNQAIEELGEEGVLTELSMKYFGADLSKLQ